MKDNKCFICDVNLTDENVAGKDNSDEIRYDAFG